MSSRWRSGRHHGPAQQAPRGSTASSPSRPAPVCGHALDDHLFGIYAVPAQGVSLEELEKAVERDAGGAVAGRLSPTPRSTAPRRGSSPTPVYQRDSQSSLGAPISARALATGLTLEQAIDWPRAIEARLRQGRELLPSWLDKKR